MALHRCFKILCCLAGLCLAAADGFAGVARAIQEQYRQTYQNKAMVLKIPIYAERQVVSISGKTYHLPQGSGLPRYKVGEQLRVLGIDFSGDAIKFRMGGIAAPGMIEIDFKFDAGLQEDFPNSEVFNQALQATLTEGLKYSEIEDAKRAFIEDQFEQSVQNLASSASISRESALKHIAPYVPAYQEARREAEALKGRLQDLAGQLAGAQSENRKLDTQLREQQTELGRLKGSNAALQEKMNSSLTQLSKLGEELRDVKGNAQGYQKELANIQRALNLRVDAGRDLAAQIVDLGQVLKKLQKENETLAQQAHALQASLEAQQAANARLVAANDELKAGGQKMQATIAALTSNKDSLASQYLRMKDDKEKLEDFYRALRFLQTRIVEEKTEDGVRYGKALVFLNKLALGSLEWRLPAAVGHGRDQTAEAAFYAESIDYVRATPEEKQVLRTLGDRLRLRLDVTAAAATLQIAPAEDKPMREIAERDTAQWAWKLTNQGTQDSRILLAARLINRHAQEIPLLQQESLLLTSNPVRQIRQYLQPIPLGAGILLGLLLCGIVGIFRRHKTPRGLPPPARAEASAPPEHIHKKQL